MYRCTQIPLRIRIRKFFAMETGKEISHLRIMRFMYDTKTKAIKNKKAKWDHIKLESSFQQKKQPKSKKGTYTMGEDICKPCI